MLHDPAMPKRGRSYVNQSISFPPGLLGEARVRARNLGLSFSAYVQLASIEGDTLRAPEGQHDDLADAYVLALVGLPKAGPREWKAEFFDHDNDCLPPPRGGYLSDASTLASVGLGKSGRS